MISDEGLALHRNGRWPGSGPGPSTSVAHMVQASSSDRWSFTERVAAFLIIAAVLFNAVLAILNARILPLSPAMVIAFEAFIVGGAHALALLRFNPRMTPWYALIGMIVAFAALKSALVGGLEVKYLRDVLLIPTFILLGITIPARRIPSILVILQLVLLAVIILEASSYEWYSSLFNVKSYYINTRGYSEENFWNAASDLFPSATRPSERFFSFLSFHRMSSMFLEPVSLGNYCIIITSYLVASYRHLTRSQRLILLVGTIVLLLAADSRLGTVCCALIPCVSFVIARLPERFTVFTAPSIFLCALVLVAFLGLTPGADDFPGRVAYTMALLQKYQLQDLIGMSDRYVPEAMDSGLAYLIATQSLFMTVVLWLFITALPHERTREAVLFKAGTALYLCFSMLVSFSFLSIKTAAILWFIFGSIHWNSDLEKA